MKMRLRIRSFSSCMRQFYSEAILVILVILGSIDFEATAQGVSEIGEVSMRWSAIHAPIPMYPKSAVAKGVTGVVVASVLIGVDGRVETVVVLEAPDPSLSSAVTDAVKQWTFSPGSHPGPNGSMVQTKLAGNLTFYFRISDGVGRVLNPEEMPGARWPKRAVPSNTKGQPATKAPVFTGVPDSEVAFIDKEELTRQLSSVHPVILDIRDRDAFRRGHLEGALNIPFAELQVRAPIELSSARPIVVDCSQDQMWCSNPGIIVQLLRRYGFARLSVYR